MLHFAVNDVMALEEVDFDEPMDVGVEAEKQVIKEEIEPEPKTAPALSTIKVQPKEDPALL